MELLQWNVNSLRTRSLDLQNLITTETQQSFVCKKHICFPSIHVATMILQLTVMIPLTMTEPMMGR
jgi:hypothetical protein